MRNATGERANTFEALGTQELRLEFLLLSDIRVDTENGTWSPVGVAHDRRPSVDDHLLAIFCDLLEFAAKFPGGGENS